MGYMLDHIGEPAMYEQMAEECAELAKAALKMARIERGENPTPKTKEQAMADLTEEYTDVCICADELGLKADPDIAAKKLARCVQRQNQLKSQSPRPFTSVNGRGLRGPEYPRKPG